MHSGHDDLDEFGRRYTERTNPRGLTGTPDELLRDADVFIGVSGPCSTRATSNVGVGG
jgi:hypothetical protein